jgi:exosome complex RNA-binding protein Rrp4
MIWKNALKYPVLIIGIIMFSLFLSDEKTKIWWDKVNDRYIPSTCDALLSRVKSKLPSDWDMECENKDKFLIEAAFSKVFEDQNKTRSAMYMELANMLSLYSHYANPETLERLRNLTIFLNGKEFKIMAVTDGQAVVKIKAIKDKRKLLEHLKLTVKIKETKIKD